MPTNTLISAFKLLSRYTRHLVLNDMQIIENLSVPRKLRIKIDTSNATGVMNILQRYVTYGDSWLLEVKADTISIP